MAHGFHRSTNRHHATQQNGKHHFAMPSIIDSYDMGLRTILQSRCPKRNAYSTPIAIPIITHILKKNMQITGNHQMAWIAQRKHLDDFLRGRVIGRTQLEVSEELGIAQSVISRLWQRFQDDGNVSRCYSTGRPRVTTPNEDRCLAVTAKRNRRSTATDLSRQLSSATCTTVSRQTVYRRVGHWSICS
ncbi:transposable element Tcb1 transposase [Trichonephila clavipes]|nr:transposable element Tcb1 transposase [Trichonephila clavipes]